MPATPTTAGLPASPPAPPARPLPPRIDEILDVLAILTSYGRHLADTLERRAAAGGFATIAQFFGTIVTGTIRARILRGLMRAAALERLLLRRAARGRDLSVLARRTTADRAVPLDSTAAGPTTADPTTAGATAAAHSTGARSTPADSPTAGTTTAATAEAADQPLPETATADADAAATPAALRRAAARVARRVAAMTPLTLDTLPSMAVLEAEVARCSIGQTMAEICRDLGISPALCDGPFWGRLFDSIDLYRGNLVRLVQDVKRQAQQFERDDWQYPQLGLPENTREGVRRVLGFYIGEPPRDPCAAPVTPSAPAAVAALALPPAAAATGPP
jgi:hypothetical protein